MMQPYVVPLWAPIQTPKVSIWVPKGGTFRAKLQSQEGCIIMQPSVVRLRAPKRTPKVQMWVPRGGTFAIACCSCYCLSHLLQRRYKSIAEILFLMQRWKYNFFNTPLLFVLCENMMALATYLILEKRHDAWFGPLFFDFKSYPHIFHIKK